MKETILEIKDLQVSIGERQVIQGLNLVIRRGDAMVLLGQNGSGKTSLLLTIMGFPSYRVTKGDILFLGESILGLTIDQRARRGLGMMFQRPPTVRGVKLRQMVAMTAGKKAFALEEAAQKLSMTDFLERDLNLGFSGGEMKRSELLQVLAQEPQMILLDEPESGVDLENITVLGTLINEYLGNKDRAALIITHTGHILDYVKSNTGCVLADSRLHCIQDPRKIIQDIRKYGYDRCVTCKK